MVVRNKMYWNVTVHYLSLGIKSLHVCSYILLEGETNAKYHSATLRTFYDSFIDESCLEISLGYNFMNTQQYNKYSYPGVVPSTRKRVFSLVLGFM